MEILALVRRSLEQAGQLRPFKVALHASLDPAQLPRLQGMVSKLGAEAVTNAGGSTSLLIIACDGVAHVPVSSAVLRQAPGKSLLMGGNASTKVSC